MIWSLSVGMAVFVLSALLVMMGASGLIVCFRIHRRFDMPTNPQHLSLMMMSGVMFCAGLMGVISLFAFPRMIP